MPIKRPQFINGEIYHIVIRGIGDSLIFREESDYYRGIYSLYEFNTTNSIEIRKRRNQRQKAKSSGEAFSAIRDPFVEILAFCLMPNHIHLLLRQRKIAGVSEFLRKFGAGYVGFFNKKHNRKGSLFMRFRAVHVKNENQLRIVFTYIHTNPISIIVPNWKEKGIEDSQKVIEFLEGYKWSSYPDYIGKNNFPSLTKRHFLLTIIGDKRNCKEFIKNWVKFKEEINAYPELILD